MTCVAARDKNNPPHNHNSMENNSGAFSINRTTGDIFLHSALDRETFSSDPDIDLNSRHGEEAASFTIDPANGEVRIWWDLDREEQEQATLTITDNAGPGDFLYKMEVRDEDSGANSQLQYFLLGEAGRFSLDQNTGGGGWDRGRRPGEALHR